MLDDRDYMRPGQSGGDSRGPSAAIIIIIITVVVFLAQNATHNFAFLGAGGYALTLFKSPSPIRFQEIWQIVGSITYMFMHSLSDKSHIFWNMFGTYVFGSHLERVIGKKSFVRLYLGSGFIAGFIWFLFTSRGAVIGASGALFGIMIAAALITPNLKMLLFFVIPIRLKWLATGYTILTVLMLGDSTQISHLAHLGGAIGGILFTAYFHRSQIRWFPFASLFKPSGGPRTRKKKKPIPFEKPIDSKTLDKILDKIGQHGMSSLTDKERRQLEQARRRLSKNDR